MPKSMHEPLAQEEYREGLDRSMPLTKGSQTPPRANVVIGKRSWTPGSTRFSFTGLIFNLRCATVKLEVVLKPSPDDVGEAI
ncbi:MAG: hypothetical protein CMJ81_05555 [Planctomycetaceae bacterium]|nr:hypothetical protein [Planctomycetaceae bacterium]